MQYTEFKSEAELCAAFIKHNSDKWTAYQECCDFDIVMVRKSDGLQIGIEAKLKLNAKVICQVAQPVTKYYADAPQPDMRAVLVPWGSRNDYTELLQFLHITPIFFSEYEYSGKLYPQESPSLPSDSYDPTEWFELCPAERCRLPDYVPDVVAGVAGPTKLTPWKVKAIKIAVSLDREGYVTRQHFKHFDLSPTLWTQKGWIGRSSGDKGYTKNGELFPDFSAQHPVNYEQIAADYDKWKMP